MPSQIKIDEVEAALIQVLATALGSNAKVDSISTQDIDANGNLIAVPPCVLVLFEGETLTPQRDHLRLDYQTLQQFSLLVGTRNLATVKNERTQGYLLVDMVRDAVAGTKLQLAAGKTEPMTLLSVQMEQFSANGTWLNVRATVSGCAQFTPKA